MLYFTIACGIPLLSLSQLYICLYLPLAVVWQASAVDRKILISPRFGACTVPPLPQQKAKSIAWQSATPLWPFYVLHFSPWHWQFDCGVSRNDHVHKPQQRRHEAHSQPPPAVEPPASTTTTCLNVSHIESAIKHTKWLWESTRLWEMGLWSGATEQKGEGAGGQSEHNPS